jgi:hypothetical protein
VSIQTIVGVSYDVTVTVARHGAQLPDPAEFALAADQAASSRNASVVNAHTAEQIISVVTDGRPVRGRGHLPWPSCPKR